MREFSIASTKSEYEQLAMFVCVAVGYDKSISAGLGLSFEWPLFFSGYYPDTDPAIGLAPIDRRRAHGRHYPRDQPDPACSAISPDHRDYFLNRGCDAVNVGVVPATQMIANQGNASRACHGPFNDFSAKLVFQGRYEKWSREKPHGHKCSLLFAQFRQFASLDSC